ncbi:MAG: hypothetical protein A2583_13385 [Bdellovibrionales bacterium RIFOXYD1_FULL_53_11]|nr:MAG: hypothetical protein A2583_13385 [Bdellovibrionales bacterium RIFOXYD1_FULL_53_11]
MRRRLRVAIQIAVLVVFALVLWRIFPYVAVFIEGAALNIRRFWWIVLLIALGIWLYWVLRSRNPG